MHWLQERLERLQALAPARDRFLGAVRQIATEVADHEGVTACFVCHEGLVVAAAGRGDDFDALSAMTQHAISAAVESASTLELGPVHQMVIVGSQRKLSLFVTQPVAVGILSPSTTTLSEVLRR